MQHSIETPSSVEKKLIISFEPADVNKYIDKAVKNIGKTLDLDGFRKGKVPAKVIERRFPEDVQSRASDALINDNIQKILTEADIHPISRIQFTPIEGNEDTVVKRDAAYKFACSFEVLPAIDLPELSSLTVQLPEPSADPKALEAFTRRIRQTGATLEEVKEERLPENYDICLIDVDGTFEGKPVPGMKGEGIQIQLVPEDDDTTKDVQRIVRGLKAGEEATGKITVSKEYPDPTFRNQEIDMRVKLHTISSEVLPELDDEFAQKFGLPDLDSLNKFISENVMTQQLQKTKSEAQTKLIDDTLETFDFELPPSLVAAHKNEYLMEARNFLMQQGQDPKDMTDTLQRMEEDAEKEARKQAKAQSFLLSLAFREKITISENEMQEYIYKAAQESGQDPKVIMERLYQSGSINDVQERLLASKAAEVMYAKANKVVVDKDGNPVQAKEETSEEASA